MIWPVRARYKACLREQHKKAAARVASTKGSGAHWEQGPYSWVGLVQSDCDLKEFKHHASHCFSWAARRPRRFMTLGDPCWFASGVSGNRHVTVAINIGARC